MARVVWCLAVGLSFSTAFAANAQSPKPSGKLEATPTEIRAAEHKLLAQFVEYLHRDTFPPDAVADDRDDPPGSGQLKSFIEGRKVMLGHIMARLREIKGQTEVEGLYDDYGKVLDEASRYADAVRKHELAFYNGKKLLRDRLNTNVEVARLLGAANIIQDNARTYYSTVGWWRWSDPWERRAGVFAGTTLTAANTFAGNMRFQARVLEYVQQYKERVAAYDRVEIPRLHANMRGEEQSFQTRLAGLRPAMLERGAVRVDKLTGEFNWKPFEVTFRPFDDGFSSSANPFAPLSALNRARKIDSTEQARECEKLAERLLDMLHQTPTPTDGTRVYARVRADIAFLAGMHANRAAEYQLGDAGFKSLKRAPLPAGKTALQAFDLYKAQYVGAETMHPKWLIQSQMALADAYAGFPQKAYDTINRVLPQDEKGITDPQYFYDAARLRCQNERDNRHIPAAMQSLTTAFMLGYKNTEKARVSADFFDLRTSQKDFEKTIDVFKE